MLFEMLQLLPILYGEKSGAHGTGQLRVLRYQNFMFDNFFHHLHQIWVVGQPLGHTIAAV